MSMEAGLPLAAARGLEVVNGAELIPLLIRASQKGTPAALVAQEEAGLSRPAPVSEPLPELATGQAQPGGYAVGLGQVQPDLVAAAALTAAQAGL